MTTGESIFAYAMYGFWNGYGFQIATIIKGVHSYACN